MKLFVWLTLLVTCFAGQALAWDYKIGSGDILAVSVWGEADLSVEAVVRPDGKITLPAAGEFVAADKTPLQLAASIEEALYKFIRTPIVTVAVTGITNNKIYVSGGGVPARVINIPGQTTLFKLLCTLEGMENVDLRNAYLSRNNVKKVIDFHDLFAKSDLSKDIPLQPEDIISLPSNETNQVYVLGAVKDPKAIPFREGIRVLDALFEAGGLNDFAKKSHIILFRGKGEGVKLRTKELLNGKDMEKNIELEPGDYLFVQDTFF
jgi:polysaccharide export outer membrane protein